MRTILAAVLILAVHGTACAETVYLHGGSVLRGAIVKETQTAIHLEVRTPGGGKALVILQRTRIRRIAKDAETPESMTSAGMRALKAGELDRAESLFRDALRVRPTHTGAMVGVALTSGARGQVAEAITKLRRALLLVPTDPMIWYHLGVMQIKAGRQTDARRSFERALRIGVSRSLSNKIRAQMGRIKVLSKRPTIDTKAMLARKTFDKKVGNNANAAAAGTVCLRMLKNLTKTIRTFDGDIFVELKAPLPEERHFQAGGSKLRYQTTVRVCQISFLVSIRSWELLTNREKRQIIGSWVRYLKDLYPYATTICVVSDGRRYLAEAIWYDIQNDVKIHWYRSRDSRRH